MIYDVFTFNGEYDLLEIRLNILDEFVDQFIIVEARTTFSGKRKPLYYEEQKDRYKKWESKIKYFVIDENYTQEEQDLANSSPNTIGAAHWKHEFLQKESIKKALTHLNDDDTVFIGDVDEIWNPDFQHYKTTDRILKLKLKVYCYYLNNRSAEEFWGTIKGLYKNIKNECLNHLRSAKATTLGETGWHFTSMGGLQALKKKLDDSYTEESYWNEVTKAYLYDRYTNNRDFLGRNFTYVLDESGLPKYIKDNKKKYEHLFK